MRKLVRQSPRVSRSSPTVVLVLALVMVVTIAYGSAERLERTYNIQGPAHLTISNINGDIAVSGWDRKFISLRATTTPPARVEDHVSGNEIRVSVKRRIVPGRANFTVFVPPETSVSLTNVIGSIEVNGVTGDVAVDSIDGDIRLRRIHAASVDVKVTTGNITFEGDLRDNGTYNLQSVRGDIDVTLPAATAFDLSARSMSGTINLADFIKSLTGGSKLRKGVSGTHLKSGTKLTLTTFNGRVMLHKQ
jgi:hypothetical protein